MTLALFLIMNVVGPAYLGYADYSLLAVAALALTVAFYKVVRGWRLEEGASLGASIVRGYLFSIAVAAPVYFLGRWAGAAA